MEWQPIATAPKDGARILAAHTDAAMVVYWQTDHTVDDKPGWAVGDTDDDNFFYTYPVAHRMPLPALPRRLAQLEKNDADHG